MSHTLITNYLLPNGQTLQAGTTVTKDNFTTWEDEFEEAIRAGAIVEESDIPALEEIAALDEDGRDQLHVLAGNFDERELTRRRLRRDGRSANEIEVILGNDDETQSALADANTPTPTTETEEDGDTPEQ